MLLHNTNQSIYDIIKIDEPNELFMLMSLKLICTIYKGISVKNLGNISLSLELFCFVWVCR